LTVDLDQRWSPVAGPAVNSTNSVDFEATNLLIAAMANRAVDDTIAGAEQVLRRCQQDVSSGKLVAAALAALIALIYSDQLDKAGHWCAALLRQLPAQSVTWHTLLMIVQAEIALRRGNLPFAERCATDAVSEMTPKGWGVAMVGPLSQLVAVSMAMDKHASA